MEKIEKLENFLKSQEQANEKFKSDNLKVMEQSARSQIDKLRISLK